MIYQKVLKEIKQEKSKMAQCTHMLKFYVENKIKYNDIGKTSGRKMTLLTINYMDFSGPQFLCL